MNTSGIQNGEPGPNESDALLREVRWHDYLPALTLVVAMMFAWLVHLPSGMLSWGVSATTLAHGSYQTIPLHVFAHGGWSHILMNSASLLEIGGLVVARLGAYPKGWVRFLAVFGFSGLSSMIFFLSFHPQGSAPMIGASGAIYGLIGLLLFMRLSEELDPVEVWMMPCAAFQFVRNNVFFLFLLLISAFLAGLSGGIAWEAHLGGFIFGLCAGPWVVPVLSPGRPEAISD
jgi:membrane associated rhomboid family serine protease